MANFNSKEDNGFNLKINFSENLSFSYKYYTFIIHQYFLNVADVVLHNFIYDNEFWFIDSEKCTAKYNTYKKFTIRVDFDKKNNSPELVISYDGATKVSKKSILDCTHENIASELFSNVIFEKQLYKFKFRPEAAKRSPENVFPIVNYRLHRPLGIDFDKPDISNKCKRYKVNIDEFLSTYLNRAEFKKIIPHTGQWQIIPDSNVKRTKFGSNKLLFGNDAKDIIPHEGIKTGGPIELVKADHVKLFFIYHTDDKKNLEELKKFINGQRGFLSFARYLKFLPTFNEADNIEFKDKDNPMPDV